MRIKFHPIGMKELMSSIIQNFPVGSLDQRAVMATYRYVLGIFSFVDLSVWSRRRVWAASGLVQWPTPWSFYCVTSHLGLLASETPHIISLAVALLPSLLLRRMSSFFFSFSFSFSFLKSFYFYFYFYLNDILSFPFGHWLASLLASDSEIELHTDTHTHAPAECRDG